MTAHNHQTYQDGCFRCDLSRTEALVCEGCGRRLPCRHCQHGGNTVDAHDVIAQSFAKTEGRSRIDYDLAARNALARLEAAGYRVVPADLVTNAEAVCEPADDDDWTIVRKSSFDALAASLAAVRGDDPLNVFAGNP